MAAVPAAATLLVLAGCGSDPVKPAPDAAAPACSALIGRLPQQVLSHARNQLDVAGAATWGKPAIVLRCGVPATGPTGDPCLDVNGLDWVFTSSKSTFQFVSYGRTPAIEVQVPTSVGQTVASGALIDLAAAVKPIKATLKCT